ncbi:MAG: AarF/ABC1/UbiB kinase family protein [Myxococcales bacterium]|nr:AarF/ABC1/UbiB kinase family protein [Myxococcales bacterium]
MRFRARFHAEPWIEHRLREVHLRNARRIERAICELQGLFIKVGQLISIMTNFLPEEFRRELEGLQDAVPPRAFADIERRLREELGRGPEVLFASFEERPIASASIGQVHRAQLHSGQRVAVKVQYPDIEEIVRSDLRTLQRIFRIVSWFVPYHGLDEVYREIRVLVLAELDYRAEADNGRKIGSNFEGRSDVRFPIVVAALSTSRVLTTHFETGCKISDIASLRKQGSIAPRWRDRSWRSTASRSSPTASITPIRTPAICWCRPTPAARRRSSSSISARSPRSRPRCARASSR